MTERIAKHRLQIATVLQQFIDTQVLPGTGVTPAKFWKGVDAIVADLAPKNIALLAERERLQTELDSWHAAHPGPINLSDSAAPNSMPAYRAFLEQIGYLVPSPQKARISTTQVDAELAVQAGPQLVVPILNARYALNAANSRWGSLYDALYGTDVIDETKGCERVGKKGGYNPRRGAKVIEYARHVLDRTAPLRKGSHVDSVSYRIKDGKLAVKLADGSSTSLANPAQLIGFQGDAKTPSSVLLQHNGLHLDIIINRSTPIGASDPAGVCDLVLEAALSTILDLEDSIAAVDADDKVLAYSNWLGILQGTLTESVTKGDKTFTRGLNADRLYTPPSGKGKKVTLHGRSLMFVRNVGHLMTNPAILYTDKAGVTREIPEGILDAVVTTTIAMHDLKRSAKDAIRNSRKGSVYIVKPKMHGPFEVAFAAELFSRVEKMLGLPDSTVKLGIMDEERRTSVNLKACIAAASSRVAFINTGFLDRTGDEMHSAMQAGAMIRKGDMKSSAWIAAYERNNVLVPLMRLARQGANRQRHVGHAGSDERHAQAKDRPPLGRCQHRLGAQPHRRHAARAALPPGAGQRHSKGTGKDRLQQAARQLVGWLADHSRDRHTELVRRRETARARQQRARHPRLRGALDRPGRRLLQGARHPQRRADGRPRHAAHQQPAHGQLAAPRGRHRSSNQGNLRAHGSRGGRPERRRPAVPADGRAL